MCRAAGNFENLSDAIFENQKPQNILGFLARYLPTLLLFQNISRFQTVCIK